MSIKLKEHMSIFFAARRPHKLIRWSILIQVCRFFACFQCF